MTNNLSRAMIAAAIAGAVVVGSAADAGAVTSHNTNKNETTFAVSCANGFTGSAVVRRAFPTGNKHQHPSRWFVMHVVGGPKHAKVLVPTKIDVTFTFTSSSGTVTTNTENVSKKSKAPKQTTCNISGTKSTAGGTLQASGSVTGAFH
ncbi:MAG: hypothetical protein ACYDGN_02630 [Acidimicrobiales bacterium]